VHLLLVVKRVLVLMLLLLLLVQLAWVLTVVHHLLMDVDLLLVIGVVIDHDRVLVVGQDRAAHGRGRGKASVGAVEVSTAVGVIGVLLVFVGRVLGSGVRRVVRQEVTAERVHGRLWVVLVGEIELSGEEWGRWVVVISGWWWLGVGFGWGLVDGRYGDDLGLSLGLFVLVEDLHLLGLHCCFYWD